MKVILSPADETILKAAENILHAIYTAQLVVNNVVIDQDDLFKAEKTIDNVLREYNRTIEGIREGN